MVILLGKWRHGRIRLPSRQYIETVMKSAALAVIATTTLVGCDIVPPLPPLELVSSESKCGHLRQDAPPDAYPLCIQGVEFANQMRIEQRQRYMAEAADWTPPPVDPSLFAVPVADAPVSMPISDRPQFEVDTGSGADCACPGGGPNDIHRTC